MEQLEYKDRWTPMYKGSLAELIASVEHMPPNKSGGGDHRPKGSMFLCTTQLSHLRPDKLQVKGPYRARYAHPTPLLTQIIGERCSIYAYQDGTFPNGDPGREHYLELVGRSDGSVMLYVKYSQLLGSYCLIEVDPAELDAFDM